MTAPEVAPCTIPEIRDLVLFRNAGQGISVTGIGSHFNNSHAETQSSQRCK
jgi:hypothetical protein